MFVTSFRWITHTHTLAHLKMRHRHISVVLVPSESPHPAWFHKETVVETGIRESLRVSHCAAPPWASSCCLITERIKMNSTRMKEEQSHRAGACEAEEGRGSVYVEEWRDQQETEWKSRKMRVKPLSFHSMRDFIRRYTSTPDAIVHASNKTFTMLVVISKPA